MERKYMLFSLGVIGALFLLLRLQGGIQVQWGKEQPLAVLSSDVSSSVVGELRVSPYGVEDKLLEVLADTAYTLDMRMYQLTAPEVLNTLDNLGFLGVDIDIVLENKPFGGTTKEYDAVVTLLEPYDADIVTDDPLGTNFVHAKVLLLDSSRYIISTANLSYPSFRRNREYRFVGNQPDIAENLAYIFTQDLAGENLKKKDIHPSLLICPIDCREKITDRIRDAQESIWIQAQYIQDDALVAALRKKQLEGVDVRIIVGSYQDDGWLENFTPGVKMMKEYYLHAKNILIDQHILVMGSMNLSTNALDNNREIGIIIDDVDVVEQFSNQFERDWEEAELQYTE